MCFSLVCLKKIRRIRHISVNIELNKLRMNARQEEEFELQGFINYNMFG